MTTAPLRVGVLVDSLVVPKWMGRCIETIQRSDFARISLIVENAAAPPAAAAGLGVALYGLYRRLDDRRHKTAVDPLDRVDLTGALENIPRLAAAVSANSGGQFAVADVEKIRDHRLDVLLRLGFLPLNGPVLGAARFGVWSFDFGEDRVQRGIAPGFPDLAAGNPIASSLVRETLEGPQVLYRSTSASDRLSMARTRPNLYFKTAAFAARQLSEVHSLGDAALRPVTPVVVGSSRRPATSGAVARDLVRLAARSVLGKFDNLRRRDQWLIGCKFRAPGDADGPALGLGDFRLIEPPPGHFWADPFPLLHDDRHYVFFEDYPYATRKGHLSVVALDEQGAASPPTEVLKTDFHLSFPNVFWHRGELVMLPESSAARQIQLYRCERFPDRWRLAAVLIDNIAAVDPVVFQRDDRWWMFVGTREPDADGSDEVSLFHAPDLLGPWTPHPRNPVRSDVFGARPAGQIFERDGSLYRPAQDCSKRYGHGLVINRIDRVSTTEYAETEVARLSPEGPQGFIGVHTINSTNRITVVDFLRRQPRQRA